MERFIKIPIQNRHLPLTFWQYFKPSLNNSAPQQELLGLRVFSKSIQASMFAVEQKKKT
jgi:hypothetical protein